MGQDVGHELGGKLQELSSRLTRGGPGWARQEAGAQLVGDGEYLGCVLVAETRRRGLALTGRVDQCGELGRHTVCRARLGLIQGRGWGTARGKRFTRIHCSARDECIFGLTRGYPN